MVKEINAMVEEALPMPNKCVFERNRCDYRRKVLVEKITLLLNNFVQSQQNEHTRIRAEENRESSPTYY